MNPDEIRCWVANRRAAALREAKETRRAPPGEDECVRRALSLIALAGRLHGWPLPEDPVSLREDRLGYERWARLRRNWSR